MSRRVMHRSCADNVYLHRDFHGALSCGLEYVAERYGSESVREYLRQFVRSYYSPLRARLRQEGLKALRDHYREIYDAEGGDAEFHLTDDELLLRTASCPAVTHIRKNGYALADDFIETIRTVNEALCADTAYGSELLEYDPETGASVQRFYRLES